MNLHTIAANVTRRVTPKTSITVKHATGYTVSADGTQIPTYSQSTVQGDVQPLSTQDLKKIEGLNVQNVTQKVYLTGDFEGVFRKTGRGGDLLEWGGNIYLVTAVLERWPTWTAVGVTMQVD